MSGHAIALATRGIIYKGTGGGDIIVRYVLPFNLQLNTDIIKINLKHLDTIKLNAILSTKKLNLIKLPNLKLNQKLPTLKLNLKKCED